MAKTRFINTSIRNDSYVEQLDPTEKLLFIYLISNDQLDIAGIYELSLRRMSFETGIEKDMIAKILKRFEEAGKIVYYKGRIRIVKFGKHQTDSPNMRKGIERNIGGVPQEVRKYLANTDTYKGLARGLQGSTQTLPLLILILRLIPIPIPILIPSDNNKNKKNDLKDQGGTKASLEEKKELSEREKAIEILSTIKEINDGVLAGESKKNFTCAKGILSKLSKHKQVVNKNFTEKEILQQCLLLVKESEYHRHKIGSPAKILANIGELLQIANTQYVKIHQQQAVTSDIPTF